MMLVIGLVAKYDSKTNNSMYSLILVLSLRHNLHFQCLFGLQQHVLYSLLILFFFLFVIILKFDAKVSFVVV